ncbi:MAG: amidohydrolase family protein, partial [Dehalococcoidia bacterium]
SGSVVSPTISVGWLRWQDDGRRQQRGDVVRGLLEAGCRFVMSTDCGIPGVPHDAIADGLRAFCEYGGIEPSTALRLATSDAAGRLGLPDRGVLEPGRRADLMVVAGDPLKDLEALSRVRAVFVAGHQVAGTPL